MKVFTNVFFLHKNTTLHLKNMFFHSKNAMKFGRLWKILKISHMILKVCILFFKCIFFKEL